MVHGPCPMSADLQVEERIELLDSTSPMTSQPCSVPAQQRKQVHKPSLLIKSFHVGKAEPKEILLHIFFLFLLISLTQHNQCRLLQANCPLPLPLQHVWSTVSCTCSAGGNSLSSAFFSDNCCKLLQTWEASSSMHYPCCSPWPQLF